MEQRAFADDVEVNGQTVWSVIDGMGSFTALASQYLLGEGIGVEKADGTVEIDKAAWYSQRSWLRAFEKIAAQLGHLALYTIGFAIPRNARFPPLVRDVDSAVQSLDVAHHMNHRRGGVELFDPTTGKMGDGIGHYGYEKVGPNKIVSRCNNPYPCSFDLGVLTSMVQRFDPAAQVVHDHFRPCRSRGASECTYVVSWSSVPLENQ
jgi:hypothetical protein